MTKFLNLVKKFPCISAIVAIIFLVMTARVQGNIATLTERTIVNFVSGIIIISILLYLFLYLSGSLNPGDKPIVDFKKIGEKLLKGNGGDKHH